MNNRDRVLAALKGDAPDRVPFTIYEWKIPWGFDKRKLVERGLTLMRRLPGYTVEYPHCELSSVSFRQDGKRYEREIVVTPRGRIEALFLPDQTCGVRRPVEFWIKGEADYEPVMFWMNDAVISPAYDEIRALKDDLGEDGVVYLWSGYSPLQEIIIRLIGIEQFCYELADRPDRIWALYDCLRAMDRKKYPILAGAPVELVQCCGNPIASLLGRDLFVERILPPLAECAEVLHAAGKLQSIHIDGDNAVWARDLACSTIDVLEAFTPSPDTDLTTAEARSIFRGKILWVNFPSSLHLASTQRIRTAARDILDAAGPGDGFLLGITEDIPADCWRKSLTAILDVVEAEGMR
jgi:hypothetical protein